MAAAYSTINPMGHTPHTGLCVLFFWSIHMQQIYPSNQMLLLNSASFNILSLLGGEDSALKRSLSARGEQWIRIYQYAKENGLMGLVLAQEDRFQWAIISRDLDDENDVFRYTLFDRKGFFGHGVHSTPEGAVKTVFDMGYRRVETSINVDEIAASWIH